MQAGFSSMNDLTVLQASQGLAKYVLKTVQNAQSRGIVIGHDHRYNSKRFAQLTALAFSHLGFKVYLYGRLVHTPLVPFGVDELDAACGVMITASHNPAQDNGYKVYWENGCQIIPPHDEGIAVEIGKNLVPWTTDTSLVRSEVDVADEMEDKYFAKIKATIIGQRYEKRLKNKVYTASSPTAVRFVYTAMHGVGLAPFMKAVDFLGLRDSVVIVNEQSEPDPAFPTVSFPNPEESGALDLAKACADKHGISIVLANDPDADRFAVAVKDIRTNEWIQLTGNQLGALFAENAVNSYLKKRENAPISKLALLNSTVSSQLIASMAKVHGFHYEDTLTGFKWIGNRAIDLEKAGFVVPFAFEEAIGYMFPVVHDKDGVSAATVFMKWAVESRLKSGLSQTTFSPLVELDRIYRKYGYFGECNRYYTSRDPLVTSQIFDDIRNYKRNSKGNSKANSEGVSSTTLDSYYYPKTLGGFDITYWRDLTKGYESSTPNHVPTLPVSASSQMITLELQSKTGGATGSYGMVVRLTARGSGTEPKLKVYIEAEGHSAREASQLAEHVYKLISQEWFARLL